MPRPPSTWDVIGFGFWIIIILVRERHAIVNIFSVAQSQIILTLVVAEGARARPITNKRGTRCKIPLNKNQTKYNEQKNTTNIAQIESARCRNCRRRRDHRNHKHWMLIGFAVCCVLCVCGLLSVFRVLWLGKCGVFLEQRKERQGPSAYFCANVIFNGDFPPIVDKSVCKSTATILYYCTTLQKTNSSKAIF